MDYANLLCLNAYTSKYHFDDGSIASVRVYTAGPSGSPGSWDTPVEKDGSFYLRVPGISRSSSNCSTQLAKR